MRSTFPSFPVIGTTMARKLFVTPHDVEIFVQCLVCKKVGRLEDPRAIGASPLPSFVIPNQAAAYRQMYFTQAVRQTFHAKQLASTDNSCQIVTP
jgi:hypothetical protein